MPTERPLRLFYAMACPPYLAQAICNWRDNSGVEGRPVAEANLHLTLAFLGSQPAAAVDGLMQLADTLCVDAFTLQLDQLQMIGKDFACLTPSQSPSALMDLVGQLHVRLPAQGVVLDSRPFLPHVTLSRQVRALPEIQPQAFRWPVDRFGLYLSENTAQGAHYSELASWALAAPNS